MAEYTEHAPGMFCWTELATSDTSAAKAFYTELFGWSINDVPMGEEGVYTMLQIRGKDAAALYELNGEQRAQGVPPHWMAYVAVTSADDVAERAKSLGGTLLMGPFDVFDSGRMALVQDPTGAMLSVWEAGQHIGAQIANEPGGLTWAELITTDTDVAGKFYTQLFGWDAETADMGGTAYTSFMSGGQPAGGMMQMPEELGDVPPHWMVYFAVADCDRSVDQAAGLGARIQVPPTNIEGVGRFAVVQDPQGAVFSVIKPITPT